MLEIPQFLRLKAKMAFKTMESFFFSQIICNFVTFFPFLNQTHFYLHF